MTVFVASGFYRYANARGMASVDNDSFAALPMKRVGKPEDIAAACAFLASEEALSNQPDRQREQRALHGFSPAVDYIERALASGQ